MSEAFRKVRPGEPVRVAARAWNRIIDQVTTKPRFDGESSPWPRTNFRVRLKNNTSTGVSRWGVFKIDGVIESPTGVGNQFESWPGVIGILPEDGSFPHVVAVEPIPAGKIGYAAIDGVVQAKLLVRCQSHKYARQKSAEHDFLQTADAGPFRIIWKDTPADGEPVWSLLSFCHDRELESIDGYATGAVQLMGHGKAQAGASGCDTGLQWYTMTECSGTPSYASSYFL